MRPRLQLLVAALLLVRLASADPAPADPAPWRLLDTATADSSGIHLDQVFFTTNGPIPHLRLAPAPTFGQTASFSCAKIAELVRLQAPEWHATNWTGAAQIKISRTARTLGESDLKELLTATLQRDVVKDKGELELHLTRAWSPVPVPDEPLTVKITDLPSSGITANFLLRFELCASEERIGGWQMTAQAKLWRDIPVAQTALRRGQLVSQAGITTERRDILSLWEPIANLDSGDDVLELSENLRAGQPLLSRSVRVRPTITRGRLVEAVVQDGGLSISLKVETLEDGMRGQVVRVRNPKTRREFTGQVQNEQTILVIL